MLANLNVRIGADIAEFKAMAAKMEKALAPVRDKLQAIGASLSARVTLPIVGLGVASVKAASDVEEMESKFNVVFGSLSGSVAAWAEEHAKAVNRSKFDLQGYAATLQDTFVPMGFARDQAADLSKQMATLAIDLASFNNASEPETVDLLTSALIGNHEAVRRFGVVMTEATLNQELLRMGILGGTKAASEQEKVMARMNILFASTKDAQGDAERTSGSFANQMRGLTSAFQAAAVEIGKVLLPAASALTDIVRGAIGWFSGLSDGTKKLIVVIAGLAAAIGPLILAVGGLIALMPILSAGFTALSGPIGLALAAIGALVVAGIAIYRNWDGIVGFFRNLAKSVVVSASYMADKFLASMEAMLGWVPGLGAAITRAREYLAKLRADFAKPIPGPVIQSSVPDGPSRADIPVFKDPEKVVDTEAMERAQRIRDILGDLPGTLRAAVNEARMFGGPLQEAEARASEIKSAITDLLNEGLSPADARVAGLAEQFRAAQEEAARMASAMSLSDLLGSAGEDIEQARAEARALGEDMQLPRREAEILEGLIKRLAAGTQVWGDTSGLVAAYRVELERATMAAEAMEKQMRIQEANDAFGQSMTLAAANLQLFGDQAAFTQSRISALQTQIQALLEQGLDPMSEQMQNLFADLQLEEKLAGVQATISEFNAQMQSIVQESMASIGTAIGSAIAGTKSLGRGLQQAVGGTFANVLSALGSLAIKVGTTAIFTGKAVQAIVKSLTTLNPAFAIAAGVALIALGAAVKGSLAGAARGGGGGGGGGFASSGGSFGERSITENANADRARPPAGTSNSAGQDAPTVRVVMESRVTPSGDLAYSFTQGTRKLERQGTDTN